jgi:hypothetical protein
MIRRFTGKEIVIRSRRVPVANLQLASALRSLHKNKQEKNDQSRYWFHKSRGIGLLPIYAVYPVKGNVLMTNDG